MPEYCPRFNLPESPVNNRRLLSWQQPNAVTQDQTLQRISSPTIPVHLMKAEASPAIELRIGWRSTRRDQRADIELLLENAPACGKPSLP
jgi:hypothetical protein